MKKINIIILSVFLVVTVISCDCAQDTSKATNNIAATFVNGDLMTNVSADPSGNPLVYPSGEASITSQVKVWAAHAEGFTAARLLAVDRINDLM
jgi:hypothetical protein